ncbi:MAG: glycosyltransferase family 4 protein [candidate division Zixibacteria bacterium]|nr:glycosyltransferase family 4 protein [candidate division Zixibacteria bacterium]MBU1469741.1 glycosyltransferase family 4 protein [candidate division Zixibacteria bacterium]MBU2624472.1 glycosyltransferase family 4 protein [candidate division Zixibacteria bacterium]
MKVCHLISGDLWAGAEVQTYTLLCSLAALPNLHVTAVVLNEARLAEKLREAGIEVSVIDESRHGFFEIKSRLQKELSTSQPDILHTHRYKENILGGLVKSKCRIRHLIQTVHGIQEGFSGLKRFKMNMYTYMNDRFTRSCFSRVVAVSKDIERHLAAKYGSDRVVVIHNSTDRSNRPSKTPQEIRAELGIHAEHAIIGAVGRLVPVKALDIFLDAAARILEKRPQTTFLIAGDGPLRTELTDRASRLGIEKNVLLTGFRADILNIISIFDIFVVSSYHEGIPVSVLEAMSLEKAVVSTEVGGMREIIQDSVSGILVPPGSSDAIAEACLRILTDSDLRARIEAGATARIGEEFSAEIQRDRMLKLYHEVMNQE